MYSLLFGRTLVWSGNPFVIDPDAAAKIESDGAVLIRDGIISAIGQRQDFEHLNDDVQRFCFGNNLIIPGFVDAHVHYPQIAIIASWGERLLDWLSIHTFPEEARFVDPDYAAAAAKTYFDEALAHGVTTCSSFCTVHPESVDAFFLEAERRGVRSFAGKVCMDRNAPTAILDTPADAYDHSKALIKRWHKRGRLEYVISPRFAPTSSCEQLEMIGQLWREHPDCLLQTHISEQQEEVAWVRQLFPEHRDYLDVYGSFGLLRSGLLLGHAIHLTAREERAIRDAGASIIHCPTSNTFIGSGIFGLKRLKADGQRIALATDVGGGSSLSMLRTMAAAYEISQLAGNALHPAQLLWLATAGGAEVLGMKQKIGSLSPGFEADIVVIDLGSTELISYRASRAETIWDEIFATITMGDERAIASVWSGGKKVAASD